MVSHHVFHQIDSHVLTPRKAGVCVCVCVCLHEFHETTVKEVKLVLSRLARDNGSGLPHGNVVVPVAGVSAGVG